MSSWPMIGFSIVSEAQFQLEYDGTAVAQGLMDVRELAPALLAVGDLLEIVNLELNGTRASIKALADANFRTGSFDVKLRVVQDVITQIKGLLANQDVKDAEDVLKIAGLAGKEAFLGFLSLKKWLKNRPIEKQSEPDAEGKIKIEVSGDFQFTKEEVLLLLSSDKATQAAERIVAPLSNPGIDSVRFRDNQHSSPVIINRDDVASYDTVDVSVSKAAREQAGDSRLPKQSTRSTRIWVLEPSFIRGNKWLVEEGPHKFYVDIQDNTFLDRVSRADISFTANTGLDVALTQFLAPGKTGRDSITYTVDKVDDVIYGAEQADLFN